MTAVARRPGPPPRPDVDRMLDDLLQRLRAAAVEVERIVDARQKERDDDECSAAP